MTEEIELPEAESHPAGADPGNASDVDPPAPPEPREPMPPVESRFMFVDIAALRAKQLRRGALPRVTPPSVDVETETSTPSQKLERIAMAELDKGLIVYHIPDPDSPADDGGETSAKP